MRIQPTINVEAISYIVKQRNWKLHELSFNQMQNIIERLKNNKSPDNFGFSSKHVKNGGFVSTHFLMKYINTSFQYIEQGVPEPELVRAASLVYKGFKKPPLTPKASEKLQYVHCWDRLSRWQCVTWLSLSSSH